MIRPRFHTRSKPPSKATQERRARWLLRDMRPEKRAAMTSEELARLFNLTLEEAAAMLTAAGVEHG